MKRITFTTAQKAWIMGIQVSTNPHYDCNTSKLKYQSFSGCTITDFNGKYVSCFYQSELQDILMGREIFVEPFSYIEDVEDGNAVLKFGCVVKTIIDYEFNEEKVSDFPSYSQAFEKGLQIGLTKVITSNGKETPATEEQFAEIQAKISGSKEKV